MVTKRTGVRIGIVAAALAAAVLAAGAAGAAVVTDVLTIGTVVTSGTGQVGVPIYIQDNAGTAIGRDQAAGKRISNIVMQVTYGPNACIDTPAIASQRINVAGGILAGQSADFDSRAKVANTSQSWTYTQFESSGLIPFTAAAAPGDLIGTMVFNLTGCSAGTINLVITTSGAAEALLASDNNTSETVANGRLSVVNGAIIIAKSFSTVAPCRVIDTRDPDGPLGGPALAGGPSRTFTIANQCGIPADATDVSVNVTVTGPTAEGHLTFYPTGEFPPLVSTINYRAGQTRANNAILLLGPAGNFDVSCASAGTVNFILDVNGYFR